MSERPFPDSDLGLGTPFRKELYCGLRCVYTCAELHAYTTYTDTLYYHNARIQDTDTESDTETDRETPNIYTYTHTHM